jgi:GTPase SAR1 family protein
MKRLKVCVNGLDNAGKTSMLLAIQNIYGFESKVANLAPTMLIAHYYRPFLGNIISYWDFGGQDQFRKIYLQNPEYFENTDVLLYVIDIQDDQRFPESVTYLSNILEILKSTNYDPKNPVFICFSKYDKEILLNSNFDFTSRIEMITNLLHKTFPDLKFEFYKSSIYDLYSIVRLNMAALVNHFDIYKSLETMVYYDTQKTECVRAFMFDSTGMLLMDFPSKPPNKFQYHGEITAYMDYNLRLFRQLEEHAIKFRYNANITRLFRIESFQFEGKYHPVDPALVEQLGITLNQSVSDTANYYLSLFYPLNAKLLEDKEKTQLLGHLKEILAHKQN